MISLYIIPFTSPFYRVYISIHMECPWLFICIYICTVSHIIVYIRTHTHERIFRVCMYICIKIHIYYRFTFSYTFYIYVLPSSRLWFTVNVNAQLYIYSLFSFLYASDTFLPITTYRYHRQPSLSMHKQRDGPKVVKSRQGKPIPGPREDFATVWHRPGARRDNTASFSSRNLTVLSSLP